jgi:1,4-alpha-glucan branching enzyme
MAMASISEILKCYRDGSVDYLCRVYLGTRLDSAVSVVTCQSDELVPRYWQLSAPNQGLFWELYLKRIRPGTGLRFHLTMNDGRRVPFVPIGESDVVNGHVRIPDFRPEWQESGGTPSKPRHEVDGKFELLLEHPLEGLLADYEDGVYFTDAVEELLGWSIADRILKTSIPEQISNLGYTELMIPLYASVADRCHLDPKYNYLVYNISPDWQLGTFSDLRKLVHKLRSCGIELVPDLVFTHQVSNPYDGSSDDINIRVGMLNPYQDPDAFLFRDYGTWYFDLEDPIVRRIVIEKILQTINMLDLRSVRVDYIDGLLMQYANRPINYGSILLDELKVQILKERPWLRIIGEAFHKASDPAAINLIDSTYSPRGFALLDLLLAPSTDFHGVVRQPVENLTTLVNELNSQLVRESNYSQLHDECWQDDWITLGRPHTPWAYGAMPMGLCLARVDLLIEHGWVAPRDRVQIAVALVLLIRSLGITASFTRWMETTGCLSLADESLDSPDHWCFPWNPDSKTSRQQFKAIGLNKTERRRLISVARKNVITSNGLMKRIGISEANPFGGPLQMIHGDINSGVAGYVRWGKHYPNPALILVNLSPQPMAIHHEYKFNLSAGGWGNRLNPKSITSVSQPLFGPVMDPLQLTLVDDTEGTYQISRPMYGFESALFEVSIHGE